MFKKKMGLTALIIFVTLFTLNIEAAGEQTRICFDERSVVEKPAAVVHRSDDMGTVIEFHLSGMFVDEIVKNGEIYHKLRFPGYYTTLDIGKPQLPAIMEIIGIPAQKDVRAQVIDAEILTLRGYKVYPFQTPLTEGEEKMAFDMDRDLYRQNAFYPDRITELSKAGIWRDIRVVNLRLYPIQHNPATGEIRIYRKLKVRLDYSGTSPMSVLKHFDRPVTPQYDKMYRSLVLNYDFLNLNNKEYHDRRGRRQDYDLLIIAADRFASLYTLNELKNHKIYRGILTEIVPLSSIGINPSSYMIKNYIHDEYINHAIQWVLLVGDESELPSYWYHDDEDTSIIFQSDFWYALLDGDEDYYPEIAVGRFSTSRAIEVRNMVEKTINFESHSSGSSGSESNWKKVSGGDDFSETWHNNALFIADNDRHSAPAGVEGELIFRPCKESIASMAYSYELNFEKAYGGEDSENPYEAANADIINAVDAGQVVVNYRGHGDIAAWPDWNDLGETFNKTHVAQLNNGERTPVVFSIACRTNNLIAAQDCLGEAFTKGDDGAVAFLGATFGSKREANDTYDQIIFESIYQDVIHHETHIGDASNQAAIEIIAQHGDEGKLNAMMYLWLGDPSLTIPLVEYPIIEFSKQDQSYFAGINLN